MNLIHQPADSPPMVEQAFGGGAAGSRRWQLLVVGYGNEWRGDDAAGPMVARKVAACGLDRVRALPVPLLLPELVLDMAEAEQVFFVDASLRCGDGRIRLGPVDSAQARPVLSCMYSAGMICALYATLYRHNPSSWLLEVPASRFDIDCPVSETTARGIQKTVCLIRRWVEAKTQPFVPTSDLNIQPQEVHSHALVYS